LIAPDPSFPLVTVKHGSRGQKEGGANGVFSHPAERRDDAPLLVYFYYQRPGNAQELVDYVLALRHAGMLTFFPVCSNPVGVTIPANQAYLRSPGSALQDNIYDPNETVTLNGSLALRR